MSAGLLRKARFGLFISAVAIGATCSAQAATLGDNYDGGMDYCCQSTLTPQSGDVIGPSDVFDITSAVVSLNNNIAGGQLTVTINTYFAGVPGTGPADGTTYGSLFIGAASSWNPTGPAPYITDQYNPAEWKYAVVANGGSTAVYSIAGTQTPVTYGNPTTNPAGIIASYTTSTGGQVVMSNVNGNPISYPNVGNPWYWFRQGQAVQYAPNGTAGATGATGTFSVDPTTINNSNYTEGSITYVINDYDLLGFGDNPIALSWAMTCANDIIQGTVATTPLPATLPLFASGMGLLGFFGLRRKKQLMTQTTAIAA